MVYQDALKLQQELREKIYAQRTMQIQRENTILFCEHPAVISFGSSATENDLLIDLDGLCCHKLDVVRTRRGGQITLHNPGQLVVYPVLDLNDFKTDIRWFIGSLAEVVVLTLDQLGLESFYDAEYPGVWVKGKDGNCSRKICAIGIHLSRWISNHGFALNINNDLRPYKYFIPCGISSEDRGITSIVEELGKPISVAEVSVLLRSNFERVFDCELV